MWKKVEKYSEQFLVGSNRIASDRWASLLIFFALFLLFTIGYGLLDYIDYPPYAFHSWRQADGASMALNYYQNGMNFFNFEMHNQLLSDGHAVGEFPILYYMVGGLYHIFGPDVMVYRIFWLLILFVGIYHLYLLARDITNSVWWGLIIALFVYVSPVFVIYGFSYITDPMGVSFLYMGLYYLYRFYKTKGRWLIWLASFLIMMAGLLKVTCMFVPMAIVGLLILKKRKEYYPLLISFGLVAAWYFFAISYNEAHESIYYYTKTDPYWKATGDQLAYISDSFLSSGYYDYMDHMWYVLLPVGFVLALIGGVVHKERWLMWIMLGSVAFGMFGVLLWYQQFGDHDYYAISYIGILPIVLIAMAYYFKKMISSKTARLAVLILMGVMLNMSFHHAKGRITYRFEDYPGWAYRMEYGNLHEIRPFLKSLGMDKDTKVISIPDVSPNVSLHLMNVKGWTQIYGQTMTTERIDELREIGAEYLVIHDSTWLDKEHLQPFLTDKVGEKNGVYVYEL